MIVSPSWGQQSNTETFLKDFYSKYVFGREDFSSIAKSVCTPKLQKYLIEAYEYDCFSDVCYNIASFRSDAQDGPSDISKVESIYPMEDNWYKVNFLDMGNKGAIGIKFVNVNGKMIMDELRKERYGKVSSNSFGGEILGGEEILPNDILKINSTERSVGGERTVLWDTFSLYLHNGILGFQVVGDGVVSLKNVFTCRKYEPNAKKPYKVIIPSEVPIDGVVYKVVNTGEKVFAPDDDDADNIVSVELPNTIRRIAPLAFYNCTKLKEVNIPSNVYQIGEMAFKNCVSIEKIIMPNSVKEMGNRVFESCAKLKSIVLSENLEDIPDETFWGCAKLEKVEIPKSVTNIYSYAFRDCVNLTTVKVYSSTYISSTAFNNCPKVVIEKIDDKPVVKTEETEQKEVSIDEKDFKRQIGKFLTLLYRDYILSDEDFSNEVASMCTSDMQKTMKEAFQGNCVGSNCFSLSPFRNGFQDSTSNVSELKAVYTTKDEDWFLIQYTYKGKYLETLIEVLIENGYMWVNQVKPNMAK